MKLKKRRRLEHKTNYHKRLKLLSGELPRLVIRKSNRYVALQIVESKNAQDRIVYSSSTRELLKFGWPKEKMGSLKSLTASYLAGLLLAKKADKIKDKGKIILDMGLIPSTKGSRVYAALKGVVDGNIKIDYDKKIMPSKEKIGGDLNKLNELFNKVKGEIMKNYD